jgi:hypothetical protein
MIFQEAENSERAVVAGPIQAAGRSGKAVRAEDAENLLAAHRERKKGAKENRSPIKSSIFVRTLRFIIDRPK